MPKIKQQTDEQFFFAFSFFRQFEKIVSLIVEKELYLCNKFIDYQLHVCTTLQKAINRSTSYVPHSVPLGFCYRYNSLKIIDIVG